MLKKTVISSAIASILFLSSSGIASAVDMNSRATTAPVVNQQVMSSDSYGEIVGKFNSPDGEVVGATLPGESVSFIIPVKKDNGQYLHFAFMHADSASEGWYFAPASELGINLSDLMTESGKPVNITEQIALFRAPAADVAGKVMKDNGKLKYGAASKFMTAELTRDKDMFVINIKNISEGDYTTPFSSGVWGVTKTAARSFDHEPSSALSRLAVEGHRDQLYSLVQKQMSGKKDALSTELTRGAIKMAEEQMAGHKKIGSISGTAQTQEALEKKFAMAAAQMGAKYYVITGISNNNHTFGSANIYE